MQMHSPQAVLFDLDGTLIDTAPDFASVLNRQLLAHGRSPIPYKAVRTAVSQGSRAVVELGFGDRFSLDSDEFEAIRQEFLSHYLIHLADETRLFPGMDELLSHLETREIP
ncbi:MAG: HAD hydrolase-like protein, partial [Moraxellaceae bacterium]|nr:HAD hydrolase-like protein [Moraxellaceae bacterium]MBP9731191.1 HAD hydrolase-like protein [Moraxellaceae bacterium]